MSRIQEERNLCLKYLEKKKREAQNNQILKFIKGLEFQDSDYYDNTKFKILLDSKIYDFEKANDLIQVTYYVQKNSDNQVKTSEPMQKKKIPIQNEDQVFETAKTRNVKLTIQNYNELIDAMRCILWSLGNNPSTVKKIFQHIFIFRDGERINIPEEDYHITNKIISDASYDDIFYVQKTHISGKQVWLYNNPSNKRLGYFYNGKIRSIESLSKYYDIPRTTIQSRLKKMSIDKALQK